MKTSTHGLSVKPRRSRGRHLPPRRCRRLTDKTIRGYAARRRRGLTARQAASCQACTRAAHSKEVHKP